MSGQTPFTACALSAWIGLAMWSLLPVLPAYANEASRVADLEVLETLRRSGDNPSIQRDIDVTFKGSARRIARLKENLVSSRWLVHTKTAVEGRVTVLAGKRRQATTLQAITEMSGKAEALARDHGVVYDGWGSYAVHK